MSGLGLPCLLLLSGIAVMVATARDGIAVTVATARDNGQYNHDVSVFSRVV